MRADAVLRYIEARHPHRLNDKTRAALAVLLAADHATGSDAALSQSGIARSSALSWCRKKRLPPPSAWRNLARALGIADQLRREPDAPLARIARACGYCDHTAVTHTMRRAFGLTPARVRSMRGQAPLVARWWERQTGIPNTGREARR